MTSFRTGSFLDRSFGASLALKGLHAALETVGGIVLLIIDPQKLNNLALAVLHQEISQDPGDFVATHLLRLTERFAAGGKHFASWYLLSHGAVKLIVVLELFRNKLWAYPLMIVMLAGFIGYQMYRFILNHSLIMVFLTVFDLVVIALTWLEYQKQKSIRASA